MENGQNGMVFPAKTLKIMFGAKIQKSPNLKFGDLRISKISKLDKISKIEFAENSP